MNQTQIVYASCPCQLCIRYKVLYADIRSALLVAYSPRQTVTGSVQKVLNVSLSWKENMTELEKFNISLQYPVELIPSISLG